MLHVYIDDSGSAPEHKVVVASALIFPKSQLKALEAEWRIFSGKEGFNCFHTSECVARNPRSEFADWNDNKVSRVLTGVRTITHKYSLRGFSCAIDKALYSETLPEEMLELVGRDHYTWAVGSSLGYVRDWSVALSMPVRYFLDWTTGKPKAELDESMEYIETIYPGEFVGHYEFLKRCEVPMLQAADLYAWTNFQYMRSKLYQQQISQESKKSWLDYLEVKDRGSHRYTWQRATREELQSWVTGMYANPEALNRLREWRRSC